MLGFIGLTDCVQIMSICIFVCAEGLRISQQSFSHTCIRTFHVFLDGTSSKQNIGPGVSRPSDPSDTALGYIGNLQLKLFK